MPNEQCYYTLKELKARQYLGNQYEPVSLSRTTEIYRGKKKILYFLKETYKGQNQKSRKPEKYRTKHIH